MVESWLETSTFETYSHITALCEYLYHVIIIYHVLNDEKFYYNTLIKKN